MNGTDLLNAVQKQNLNLVKEIIKSGVDVNSVWMDSLTMKMFEKNNNNAYATYYAVSKLKIKETWNYVSKNMPVPAVSKYQNSLDNMLQSLPLAEAVIKGTMDIIMELLNNGARPNCQDFLGNTAMHAAAVTRRYNKQIMDVLIERGVDVNVCAKNGDSPLLRASFFTPNSSYDKNHNTNYYNNKIAIITYFLEHGANPNVVNKDGAFPLFWASLNKGNETVNLLIKYNASMSLFQGNSTYYSKLYSEVKVQCEKLQRGEAV
jgi:ankyrin repeat protein